MINWLNHAVSNRQQINGLNQVMSCKLPSILAFTEQLNLIMQSHDIYSGEGGNVPISLHSVTIGWCKRTPPATSCHMVHSWVDTNYGPKFLHSLLTLPLLSMLSRFQLRQNAD